MLKCSGDLHCAAFCGQWWVGRMVGWGGIGTVGGMVGGWLDEWDGEWVGG